METNQTSLREQYFRQTQFFGDEIMTKISNLKVFVYGLRGV